MKRHASISCLNSQNCNDSNLTIKFLCPLATISDLPPTAIMWLFIYFYNVTLNNILLFCCEQDLALYRPAALPRGWTLGEGGCPAGLVVVSETCKDNAEQLWLWRVQIISNSWQQLVTSSRPNSCHDIVLFYVSPTGSGALLELYRGWGRLRLGVDKLSFSFKTWWWITGYLVTYSPVLWILTFKRRLESNDLFCSCLAIESVLDQRLYYSVKWEKHKCKPKEVYYFHQSFHAFLAFVVPGCATFSFTISPPFPIPVFLSQSPPSIITVIVSRVGRKPWRQQGGDAACNWTTAVCSANGNSQIYSVDVFPLLQFFFSFSVVVSPHSLWPFFLMGPLKSEQF